MAAISATTSNAVMVGLTVFVGAGAFGNVLSDSVLQYSAALSFGAICGVTYSRKMPEMYDKFDVSSSFVISISALMSTLVITVLTASTRCRSETAMTVTLTALALVTTAAILHIVVYHTIRNQVQIFIGDMLSKSAEFALAAPSTAADWAAEVLKDVSQLSLSGIIALLQGKPSPDETEISKMTIFGIVSAILSLVFGYFTHSSLSSCTKPLTLTLTTCPPTTRVAGLVTIVTGALAVMTLLFGEVIKLPDTLLSTLELPKLASLDVDLEELRNSAIESLGKVGDTLGEVGKATLDNSKALLRSIGSGIKLVGEKIPDSQKVLTFMLFTGGLITAITESMVTDQKAKQGLFYTSVTLTVLGVLSGLHMVREKFEVFNTLKQQVKKINVSSMWESVSGKLGKLKDIRICNSGYDEVLRQLRSIDAKIDTIQQRADVPSLPISPGNDSNVSQTWVKTHDGRNVHPSVASTPTNIEVASDPI